MTAPGKNEMMPGDGMPVTVRLNDGLGVCIEVRAMAALDRDSLLWVQ